MRSILKFSVKGMLSTIKEIDIFGKDITLTYNKTNQFKTYLGGMCSAVLIALVLTYSSFLTRTLILRNNIVYSSNNVVRDLTVDTSAHSVSQYGFDFAVGIRSRPSINFFGPLLESTVQLKMYQNRYDLNQSGERVFSKQELEYVR